MADQLERLDVEAIVGDVDLPCESNVHHQQPTDQPATWVVWLVRCCSRRVPVALSCDDCLRVVLTRTRAYTCAGCGTRFAPPRTSLTYFERINRPPAVT